MTTSARPSDTMTAGPSMTTSAGPNNTGFTPLAFKKLVVGNISLSNLVTLKGKSNYQVQSNQMVMIFKTTELYDITVLDALCPADSNLNSNIEAYREIKSATMIMIIQLIFQQILMKCNRIHDSYKLWTHFKSQYYSDSPYSFIHQIYSLFTIGSSFDSN